MKASRIVVLGLALVAGGAAASLAGSGDAPQPLPASAPVAQLAATDLLIPKNHFDTGTAVGAQDFQWPQRPANQAETPALSRQTGTLSLALHSQPDASSNTPPSDEGRRKTGINAVRYGVTTTAPR